MEVQDGIYKVMTQVGTCLRCGSDRDVRMGACFGCSEKIDGEKVPGGHRLWDIDNPQNQWFVSDRQH